MEVRPRQDTSPGLHPTFSHRVVCYGVFEILHEALQFAEVAVWYEAYSVHADFLTETAVVLYL